MPQSAVQFNTERRVHISLAVSNLQESTLFYQTLLGVLPSKTRAGYARFEVSEPPLNLSIIQSSAAKGPSDSTSHFGIQVKSTETVGEMERRFVSAGLATIDEDSVNCCHAVQDKTWIVDPDGHRWEIFVVVDDLQTGQSNSADECCSTAECCLPTPIEKACC